MRLGFVVAAPVPIVRLAVQFFAYGTSTLVSEQCVMVAPPSDGRDIAALWYTVPAVAGNYHAQLVVTDVCGRSATDAGHDVQVR
jgi:hypothetical protein